MAEIRDMLRKFVRFEAQNARRFAQQFFFFHSRARQITPRARMQNSSAK